MESSLSRTSSLAQAALIRQAKVCRADGQNCC